MSYDYGYWPSPYPTPDYEKDPGDTIDYSRSWHNLGGDTIVTSEWTSDGLTVDSSSVDGLTTTATVSGGTAGSIYCLKNTVTTGMGRTLERSLYIQVCDL